MVNRQSAENLDQLSRQVGRMSWFAAYGRLPSEKMRRYALVGMLLPVALSAYVYWIPHSHLLGDYKAIPIHIILISLIYSFGFWGRERVLAKQQRDNWQFDSEKRLLTWYEKGQKIAEYHVSDEDKLVAGDFLFHSSAYQQMWVLAYRRPYPKPEIKILSYFCDKKNSHVDKKEFICAVTNISANMRLPLEWSGFD